MKLLLIVLDVLKKRMENSVVGLCMTKIHNHIGLLGVKICVDFTASRQRRFLKTLSRILLLDFCRSRIVVVRRTRNAKA